MRNHYQMAMQNGPGGDDQGPFKPLRRLGPIRVPPRCFSSCGREAAQAAR